MGGTDEDGAELPLAAVARLNCRLRQQCSTMAAVDNMNAEKKMRKEIYLKHFITLF